MVREDEYAVGPAGCPKGAMTFATCVLRGSVRPVSVNLGLELLAANRFRPDQYREETPFGSLPATLRARPSDPAHRPRATTARSHTTKL
jgi:hypothetical protein